ncbi:MAG: hypothetical protein KDA75_08825 [Planctomycetaceae bacterium]|nr:hypothetical protein [Planctomycetaceae bacterium]
MGRGSWIVFVYRDPSKRVTTGVAAPQGLRELERQLVAGTISDSHTEMF